MMTPCKSTKHDSNTHKTWKTMSTCKLSLFVLWRTRPHSWCLSKEMCSTCNTHHNFYHYPMAKRKGKGGRPVSIGTLKLDLNPSWVQNNPTLFSKLAPCFLLPIIIKGDKSTTVWTQTFINSRAFACFIDKELVQQHNLALVEKATQMAIKVIDGQKFSSRFVTHEIKVLMVIIGSHNIKVVFNVISSLANHVIIGLSWLILHNPQIH